jgi:peptidoglycan/xylan/chitin deacetylase (PgdA/CDA1 family)
MSAETFRTVGGFDCMMRTMQDWEFGLRCQKLGVPIVNAPEIEPYHQLHPTDLLRAGLDRSSLAYFKTKHPGSFWSRAAHLPGVNALLGRSVAPKGKRQGFVQSSKMPRFLCLTFDDGPHPVGTSNILRLLTMLKAKATFFALGANVVRFPGIVRDIATAGCEIGVHGWEHTPSSEQSAAEIARDLARTVAAVRNLVGIRPRFCRPPHGRANAAYLTAAERVGMKPVAWDVSARDWCSLGLADLTIELATRKPLGKVLLFHDGVGDLNSTGEVLTWLLNCARKRGVEIVTLSRAQQYCDLPLLARRLR